MVSHFLRHITLCDCDWLWLVGELFCFYFRKLRRNYDDEDISFCSFSFVIGFLWMRKNKREKIHQVWQSSVAFKLSKRECLEIFLSLVKRLAKYVKLLRIIKQSRQGELQGCWKMRKVGFSHPFTLIIEIFVVELRKRPQGLFKIIT